MGCCRMKMIRAIIRPEAVDKVADSLEAGGFSALTRIEVFGRGEQKGIKVGDMVYDNLPKTMLMLVVGDDDQEEAVRSSSRLRPNGKYRRRRDLRLNRRGGLHRATWAARSLEMKEVLAIIQMNKMEATKNALDVIGIPAITAYKVTGRGKRAGPPNPPSLAPEPSSQRNMKYVPRMISVMVKTSSSRRSSPSSLK